MNAPRVFRDPIQPEPSVWQVPATRGAIRLKNGHLLAARHGPRKNTPRKNTPRENTPRENTPRESGVGVFALRSVDDGKTWTELAPITSDPDPTTDIGDGSFCETANGDLFYVFRHNHYRGDRAQNPDYAIVSAISVDRGETWRIHDTVTRHKIEKKPEEPSRGLWAPTIFATRSGRLLCVYDDENLPFLRGFPGHQWLVGRFFGRDKWAEPFVVSRAHDPAHLSRDGMASIAETSSGHFLVAFESVDVRRPHPNLCRFVTSGDGGKTWSWERRERETLYAARFPHMALSPWLARAENGELACVFVTEEDRETPDVSGTPPRRMRLDVKWTRSRDDGRTWSAPETIDDRSHNTYLPGLIPLKNGRYLAHWLDFTRPAWQAREIS